MAKKTTKPKRKGKTRLRTTIAKAKPTPRNRRQPPTTPPTTAAKRPTPATHPPPPVPTDTAEQLAAARDAALIRSAHEKLQAGKPPTHAETGAIRRRDKQRETDYRAWCYANVSKTDFLALSAGRDRRRINELAARYELACGGRTVDLGAFVDSVWLFIETNAHKLNGRTNGTVPASPLDRRREIITDKAEIELAQMRREVIRTDHVREGLRIIATTLRGAAETIKRTHGDGPHEILSEALGEISREIKQRFGTEDD